jgi:hypothetical protein
MGQKLVPAEQALESRVGAETVILHLEKGYYYGLDPVGTRVWELIKDGNSVDAIAAQLRAEYRGAGEGVEADVRAFVDDLLENNILTAMPAPEAKP